MSSLHFNKGVLIHSTKVVNLLICLADSYPSYYRVTQGSRCEVPVIWLTSNIHHEHDPDLFGYELSYDNETRCFKYIKTPTGKTTKIVEDLKSFGFNCIGNSVLTLELLHDGTCYTNYSVKFNTNVPSNEFLYYFALKHKCLWCIADSELTILQKFKREGEGLPEIPGYSILHGSGPIGITKIGEKAKPFSDVVIMENLPTKNPIKIDYKELKMPEPQFSWSCDLKGLMQKQWLLYSLQHFYENMNLLGYPLEIDEERFQWGNNHSVHHYKWLKTTPPKELLDHLFNDTCYFIGDDYLCVNKWDTNNILNTNKKCECDICSNLRKDNDYKPASWKP